MKFVLKLFIPIIIIINLALRLINYTINYMSMTKTLGIPLNFLNIEL
jgi:hypothetical protein